MKQEFEMTQEQMDKILNASKPVAMIALQCGQPLSPQENANSAWKALGDEMGFLYMTVEGSSRGKLFFLAETKPIVKPKTQTEIEMDKYDTLQKIVNRLEACEYECEGGYLKNNIAFLKLKQMAK